MVNQPTHFGGGPLYPAKTTSLVTPVIVRNILSVEIYIIYSPEQKMAQESDSQEQSREQKRGIIHSSILN